MDLFFALRGGQIGRSVMWSNGAILPILGIICILSVAGVILIYSYNAAFEAFRKSLREKTARYLAIFLVLMELCGMTYVDLYHTHLLGGLGKTAAKLNRHGSYVSSAAQKISRLPLDSPAYKLFKDIEKYQHYGDSPYTGVSLDTLKANIEEVLEDKKLDPDIKQELRGIHAWVQSEVRNRDIRRRAWRAEEDARWERIKNTTDPEAVTMAVNRLLQGGKMSQEQLEDCYRTILLAEGRSGHVLTQETRDYAQGLIDGRLPPENLARIENEALAIWRASQEAASTNPATGALVPQNSSSTRDPRTAPVPTTGQPNTNDGSSSGTITITTEDLSNLPSTYLQGRVPLLGGTEPVPPNQPSEVSSGHSEVAPVPPVQPASMNGAAPVPQPPKTAVPGPPSGPVDSSTSAYPGQNAPASDNSSQYHLLGRLNGGLLDNNSSMPSMSATVGQSSGVYAQPSAPKNPGLFGRTLDSAWVATQFGGLPLTAPTHLMGGVSNAASNWHPYLRVLAEKNGWQSVVGRTAEPAARVLSKLPQKGLPYGKWSDLTPAQRLLHIGAAGGNLALGGYHTLESDLGRAAGAGVRAVENPSLGNAGNFVHELWNTATKPYKNMVNTVVDGVANKTNDAVDAVQKTQGDSNEEEWQ